MWPQPDLEFVPGHLPLGRIDNKTLLDQLLERSILSIGIKLVLGFGFRYRNQPYLCEHFVGRCHLWELRRPAVPGVVAATDEYRAPGQAGTHGENHRHKNSPGFHRINPCAREWSRPQSSFSESGARGHRNMSNIMGGRRLKQPYSSAPAVIRSRESVGPVSLGGLQSGVELVLRRQDLIDNTLVYDYHPL